MTREAIAHELKLEGVAASLRAAVSAVVVKACVNAFGDRMRGIILTGSLARDEATFVRDATCWSALGDAEFFVVFKQRSVMPNTTETESVRAQAERTLMTEGIGCHIDLSPVDAPYLRRLPRHIMSYELRECGQVLWGDPTLLSLIPSFPGSAILLEDAWRLLCNRLVEYLAIAEDLLPSGRPLPPVALYRTVKLYLDMATSFLLFAGEYEPTYAGRASRLRQLAAAPRPGLDSPFPLHLFADRVAYCTAFKLRGSGYQEQHAAAFWTDAITYARALWRWEMRRLTGSGEACGDQGLMRAWMRQQTVMGRLRGWVRVFRDSEWRRSWPAWPRWLLLAFCASPRHWIYATATDIFFRLPELVGVPGATEPDGFDCASVFRRLPCTAYLGAPGPTWARAADAVFSNYQRFVAVTRA